MSLEQYNVSTNPFLALSNMIKTKEPSGRTNLNHALILQQVHHAGVMEQLERGHELASQEATVAHRRELQRQKISHQQATELETLKATHTAAQLSQQHEQTIQAATVKAGLDESAASATHRRNLELHDAITKAAQAGTEVSGKMGETSFKFTKEAPKPVATVQATQSSQPNNPGLSWATTPKGAKQLPITTKPAPTAKKKQTGPSVARDPKTGRAISIKKS